MVPVPPNVGNFFGEPASVWIRKHITYEPSGYSFVVTCHANAAVKELVLWVPSVLLLAFVRIVGPSKTFRSKLLCSKLFLARFVTR